MQLKPKMETYLQRILLLPQVIQDLIAEYNVDHRPNMSKVHNELIKTMTHSPKMKRLCIELEKNISRYGCIQCDNCYGWVDEMYILKDVVYNHKFYSCSKQCKFDFINQCVQRLKLFFPDYQFSYVDC